MLNIFRNTSDNSILQVWLTIQGSVATYLRCGTIVSNYIKKALLVSLTGEKVQIGEYLTKSLARRWLCRALCATCHTLSCWKWRIHETSRYEKQLLLGCIAWTKLKDAASCYRCSVVRLCVCVCLLVTTMSCAKTSEPIEMPFVLWIRVDHRCTWVESIHGSSWVGSNLGFGSEQSCPWVHFVWPNLTQPMGRPNTRTTLVQRRCDGFVPLTAWDEDCLLHFAFYTKNIKLTKKI